METLLVQFRYIKDDLSEPSLDEVSRYFDLPKAWIDAEFGIIATDPTDALFTILVNAKAAHVVRRKLDSQHDPAVGVFSNLAVTSILKDQDKP